MTKWTIEMPKYWRPENPCGISCPFWERCDKFKHLNCPIAKGTPAVDIEVNPIISSAWALLKMAGDWIEINHKPRTKSGKEDKATYLAKVNEWLQNNA